MAKIIAIKLTAETKKVQKALQEINLTLEQQEDLINDTQRQIDKLEDKRDKTSKKDITRIKRYNEQIKEQNKNLKRSKQRLTEQKQAQQKTNKALKESIKDSKDYSGILGVIDKNTGGAISGFSKMIKGINGATKGFNLMKVAIIGTGIGALVIGIVALVQSFKRSEAGQEKFQRGMAMIGAVVKQVLDLYAKLGETIIETFTNPMESLKSLGKGITKFLSNPFKSIKDAVTGAATSVKEFVKETAKEVEVIGGVTKARQKAHHIERDLLVQRAKANNEINDIRLQAEDRENKTAAERIILLRKAQAIEESITKKEIEAKQLMVDAQILEMEQGLNTIEAKDKLAKMQAELINLDTKKLRSQRLLQTQITTAVREEQAIIDKKKKEADKKIEDDKKAAEKIITDAQELEQKRLDSIEQVQKDNAERIKEEKAITDEEQLQVKKEKEIAELEELNATEEQKFAIIAYWNSQILIAKKKRLKDEDKIKEAEKVMLLQSVAQLGNALGTIGSLLEQGTAAAKAAALADIIIGTGIGFVNGLSIAQKSAAGTGPAAAFAFPLFYAQQIGAVLGAVGQAKSILSQVKGGGGVSTPTPSAGGGGAAAIPSLPPSFETVGASSTNQLADAIGGQSQQPVQAFVVSNDVTTAQALERNTIEGATI